MSRASCNNATLPAAPPPTTTSCQLTLRSNKQLSRLIQETVHYTLLTLYYTTSAILVPTTPWNVQCKAAITSPPPPPHHQTYAYLCGEVQTLYVVYGMLPMVTIS